MTISGSYSQSVSFVLAYNPSRAFAPNGAATPAATAATPTADRVDLSPQAIRSQLEQPASEAGSPPATPAAVTSAQTDGTSTQSGQAQGGVSIAVSVSQQTTIAFSTSEQPAPASAGSSRADALFSALDANHDGSVTKQEFSEGATALLRQASGHGRHHHAQKPADGQSVEHREHVPRGLENRMGRVFSQVDANHDGAVDQAELTASLAQRGSTPAGQSATAGATDQPAPSPAPRRPLPRHRWPRSP